MITAILTYRGERLGLLGPFEVATPRWHDAGPVADHLTEVLKVPVLVLRLVEVTGGEGGRGGAVTYHAEALERPAVQLPGGGPVLEPDQGRADWATAEGLRSALGWADAELAALGRPRTGPVEQVKTWNLSGLFRLPTEQGPVWLKTTPPFGVCEAQAMALFRSVDSALVPDVLAADTPGRRILLGHLAGQDCWGAPEDSMLAVIPRLVAAQARLAERDLGELPDRTPRTLAAGTAALLAGEAGGQLTAEELADAHALLDRLPGLVAELEACGLPLTAVHGDFHPGNWRWDGTDTVLVDFSDAHLGHPALDGLRPHAFLSPERWAPVRDTWCAAWLTHRPGSDPLRALELARPLMHLSYAVRYQEFLDAIETSERIYHEGDPAAELRSALRAGRAD